MLLTSVEIVLRRASGSGSVSSTLFVDETLEGVTTTGGGRARATRRLASGASEDVVFERRGEQWFVEPFPKAGSK